MSEDHQVTRLLEKAMNGHSEAKNELIGIVYAQLHSLARNKLRYERSGSILQTTALVNEAYLRLFEGSPLQISNREHFYHLASSAMRKVLIDLSRMEKADKRGGDAGKVSFEEWMAHSDTAPLDHQLDLQKALDALELQDSRAASIVNLILFSGRNTSEAAELLGIAKRTIERDLVTARLFLTRYLSSYEAGA